MSINWAFTHQAGKCEHRRAAPPRVTKSLHTFTLNYAAANILSEMYGNNGYALKLHVSECGRYVGFSAEEPLNIVQSQQRAINSKEASNLLQDFRILTLRRDGNMLIGDTQQKIK